MRVPLGEITSVHAHQRWMTAEVDEARYRLGKSLIERIRVGGGIASVHPASASWYPSQNPNRVDRVRRGLRPEELIELYDRNGVERFFVYLDPLPGWEQTSSRSRPGRPSTGDRTGLARRGAGSELLPTARAARTGPYRVGDEGG